MLGLFNRSKREPLYIKLKSLIDIIEKDYSEGYEFNLAEFSYDNSKHIIGSEMDEEARCIFFVYDGKDYLSSDEMKKAIVLDGKNLDDEDVIVEVTRACVIGGGMQLFHLLGMKKD